MSTLSPVSVCLHSVRVSVSVCVPQTLCYQQLVDKKLDESTVG